MDGDALCNGAVGIKCGSIDLKLVPGGQLCGHFYLVGAAFVKHRSIVLGLNGPDGEGVAG